MTDPANGDDFSECDCCGEPSGDLDWWDGTLVCPKCRSDLAEEDGAADRGDHECHQGRDQ